MTSYSVFRANPWPVALRRKPRPDVRALTSLALLFLLVLPFAAKAQFIDVCVVADNGSGTATLPPERCALLTPAGAFMISGGLPPGTTLELRLVQGAAVCANNPCGQPGGNLGGAVEDFDYQAVFALEGTGALQGFRRILPVPMTIQTHSGPRNPGDPVQFFPTDLFRLQGFLPPGDPDFADLQILAGTDFGLPSPGQTTLTRLGPPGSDFQVDSFFDISYQINFAGAPGGVLEGLSGATPGVTPIRAAGKRDPCVANDDGTGTVELPPPGCDYLSRMGGHMGIIDGLPPGQDMEVRLRHTGFDCPPGGCGTPGGNLGGETENFNSTLVLQLEQQGNTDFRRTLRVPVAVETHSGPRNPGDPVQSFPTDMFSLQGGLPPGDPDFADLQIVAGTGNGLPGPGHTTLQDLGDGTFQVDSFFDITYRIDFVGAPGGALDGLSGSTTSIARLDAHKGKVDAIEPEIAGTVELPAKGSQEVSPQEVYRIIDGLPPGTTIELEASNHFFVCVNDPCGQPGGGLGGEVEQFESTLSLDLTGTGALTGFQRTIQLPAVLETHTGPRNPGDPVQSFATDMSSLLGGLPPGDPDFDQLTITAGSANGLPSPGHTTLTNQGDGAFVVDSFFDIDYRIDFVGAPGGQLDGLSGSTTAELRVTACDEPACPTVLDVPGQTFATDQSLLSAGLARSSGDLDVQAQVEIVGRLVTLGEGFSATVAPTGTLSIGNDNLSCPIPGP